MEKKENVDEIGKITNDLLKYFFYFVIECFAISYAMKQLISSYVLIM